MWQPMTSQMFDRVFEYCLLLLAMYDTLSSIMDFFENWLGTQLETFGTSHVLIVSGLFVGFLFGFFAQKSRFCLRAATLEFWRGQPGEKTIVWLITFSAAALFTQLFIHLDWMDVSGSRQLATVGSMSGALIGGMIFGFGMVLARGCVSRLLVLSAQGNLRALLTGLIVAVTAQASMHGVFSGVRQEISTWWLVSASERDLLAVVGFGSFTSYVLLGIWVLGAAYLMAKSPKQWLRWFFAACVGLCVVLAWWVTWTISITSYDVVSVQSLTFSGPSADWLMAVLTPVSDWGFGHGLLPGVFLGSWFAAWLSAELAVEGFQDGPSMWRYLAGGVFMGFGGMLAGGCAVGAGITGASVFSSTAWMSLLAMWLGAGLIKTMLRE